MKIYNEHNVCKPRTRGLHITPVRKPEERMPAYLLYCILGKSCITHSRVFPAGSAPRAFPHRLPSLRRKGPRYLIIYLFSALFTHCDHRYRSHVHMRTKYITVYYMYLQRCMEHYSSAYLQRNRFRHSAIEKM